MHLKTATQIFAAAIMTLSISACQTTKVVKTWQSSTQVSPPEKLAVIVMAPNALQRMEAERAVAENLSAAGANAIASSEMVGMRGRLTKEKAVAAMEAANADGVIIVFLLGALPGEALERSDYYLRYEGSAVAYNWFAPYTAGAGYVDVYSVQEGSGYADYSVDVYLETTYVDLKTGKPAWNMITVTQDPQYRDVAGAIAGKVVSQMKKANLL